jgi:uncharacterized protein (TIGR02145 family)
MKKLLFAVFTFAFLSISLNSSAQDYQITFAGTGAATLVDSVEVENLSTGKTITLSGGDILHLTSVVGISQPEKINSSGMRIYPNPMMDNSILELQPKEAGEAVITVYEMTGKTVAQIHTYLENGRQEYRLSGLKNSMYLISITGNKFQYSGKILSSRQANGNPGIEKVSSTNESNIEKISKKEFSETKGTVDMHYTAGDRLKFKAISGIYSTVKTDIPTEDKTLAFYFVACTDGENNNYPVVEIGGQIWMAENLKTTKYNDGTSIPLVLDSASWTALSTPGYCWNNNDSATYRDTYGALYNWYTVNSNKLCPTSWHVPTDTEWIILTDFLGGEDIADRKLREAGFTHWVSRNTKATNETGFTAIPGGARDLYGGHYIVGGTGYWWSSTQSSTFSAWLRGMYYNSSIVYRHKFSKRNGFSVRCLKDE